MLDLRRQLLWCRPTCACWQAPSITVFIPLHEGTHTHRIRGTDLPSLYVICSEMVQLGLWHSYQLSTITLSLLAYITDDSCFLVSFRDSDIKRKPVSMSTGRMDEPLDELILQDVYTWIDQIPLTRPKKNFARDFSDGGEIPGCWRYCYLVIIISWWSRQYCYERN
mgnify:CR=1 FL=1